MLDGTVHHGARGIDPFDTKAGGIVRPGRRSGLPPATARWLCRDFSGREGEVARFLEPVRR
jgi:hypothetical protein